MGQLAQAVGAPCPTLVLEAAGLPATDAALRPLLTEVRGRLAAAGAGHVLKIALLAPSPHPLFDLDYRFVQCLPGGPDEFDFLGSCGHSILASVLVAARRGLLPGLAPGDRIRLRVLNNGDHVVCEVDASARRDAAFTLHFLQQPDTPLRRLLLTGLPVDRLPVDTGVQDASLVSLGNPYVFVDARDLGLRTREELFHAGDEIFERMGRIRTAATDLLRWPSGSVFPKIAAVGVYEPGLLSARAISVPRWHPTLALTGITCLAAAACLEGTLPELLQREAAGGAGPPGPAAQQGTAGRSVRIDTPGGAARAAVHLADTPGGPVLQWVSVGRKHVRLESDPLDLTFRDISVAEEAEPCLPLTV
ncbi:PrpF domain-containing protein [Streptomyces sp. NPDC002055]|uniref:PrpF domain-containing protein n=1 Tax=Streptomyces sp. NPDC002055 TaxID=3154534 RepID=UPI00331CE748